MTQTIIPSADVVAVATTVDTAKRPTKLALGKVIFQEAMANRGTVHLTNKAFRKTVRVRMMTELGVSRPSSGSMYNAAKKEAEAGALALQQADIAAGGDGTGYDLGLGRDPKVEKPAKKAKAVKTPAEADAGEGDAS